MAEIKLTVLNQLGQATENVALLNADVFGIEPNKQVMFDAVQVYQANMRQATAKTKTRAEVRGGGKKPWRQKGTGRARAGSSRSPIWVGGGVVFGPTGKQNYKLAMNRKAHRLAVRSALSAHVADNSLVVVDTLNATKTKEFVAVLAALKLEGRTLVVVDAENETLALAARNIPSVKLVLTNNVCVYDLLNAKNVLMTKAATEIVASKLLGGRN